MPKKATTQKAPAHVTHAFERLAAGKETVEEMALEALRTLPPRRRHHTTMAGTESQRRAMAAKRELARLLDEIHERKVVIRMVAGVPKLHARWRRERKRLLELLEERRLLKDELKYYEDQVITRLLEQEDE